MAQERPEQVGFDSTIRRQYAGRKRAGARSARPVSRQQDLPPQCGSQELRKRRPKQLVCFTWDRVCKSCDTRYTPPTPVWAGFVFLAAGLLLAGVFGLFILVRLLQGDVVGIFAMACEGFVFVLGILALVQGISSLANQGKV